SARVQRPRAGGLCPYAFTGVSMKLGIDRRAEYYTTVTSANETFHRDYIGYQHSKTRAEIASEFLHRHLKTRENPRATITIPQLTPFSPSIPPIDRS
ncbi:MAG: hypothetical protein RR680_20795, partial [Hafnia sp.]